MVPNENGNEDRRYTNEGSPIVIDKTVDILLRDEEQKSAEGETSANIYTERILSDIRDTNKGYYNRACRITDSRSR